MNALDVKEMLVFTSDVYKLNFKVILVKDNILTCYILPLDGPANSINLNTRVSI